MPAGSSPDPGAASLHFSGSQGVKVKIEDVAAAIRGAHLPERTVELCLRGDLVAEWEQLDRQRIAALRSSADSLEGGPAQEYAAQQDALRERMAAETVTARFRALRRAEYTRLVASCPPRRDDDNQVLPTDLGGYNPEQYFPAIVRACWVEPVLDGDVLTHLLDEVLSQRQFEDLALAAHQANRGAVNLPNSLGASTTTRNSGDE
jgi:hypothetical protein